MRRILRPYVKQLLLPKFLDLIPRPINVIYQLYAINENLSI